VLCCSIPAAENTIASSVEYPDVKQEPCMSLVNPVYANGSSRLAMKKLKLYGLHLAKSAAVVLAIAGGGVAPVGLAFTSCMDSDQKISAYVNLWKADYCSGMVGLFLVITTAEFFYLGILTELGLIPRLSGFVSIGIMGAIAFTYMMSIVTTWN
jgi:hypothetical protein